MPNASSSEAVAAAPARRVYTVANVNRGLARRIDELPPLWVEGEIGDLRHNPKFGFVFLTLRDPDEGATLSVTMARWAWERLDPRPVEGQRVQAHGKVTLYDRRAELSLRADRIEPAGEQDAVDQRVEFADVALQLAFALGIGRLLEQLHAEADARQRRPQLVRCIGEQQFVGGHQLLDALGGAIETFRQAGHLILAFHGDAGAEIAAAE